MGRRRRIAGVVAVVALVATACSPAVSNQAEGVDRAEAARQATRRLQAAQRSGLGCDNVVMSEEARTTTPPEHLVLLTDAYAVAEPCWDKLVFTFESTGADMPPGYEIEYRKPPFTNLEGNQVETLGEAFLYLTLTPASQWDADGDQTYPGNLRLRLEGMHHTEIVRYIEGEGTADWLIGLDTKRPFTVDAANRPPRVIVYIAR